MLHNGRWDFEVFGKRTIVEEQIGTEGILTATTEKAGQAGGGVVCHNAIAYIPSCNPNSKRHNFTNRLMTEQGRWFKHSGMTPTPPDFQISSTGCCCAYFDPHLPRRRCW